MRAVLGREPRPSGISSATWLRSQRPACELFPKSPACLPRRFIASAHSHGKLEIHIVRSLSLHHEERGWCGVRGCAEQLGLLTRLWDSAGPSVKHLVHSRVIQRWLLQSDAVGARAPSAEPCLLESAPTTDWPEPSRKSSDMSAARRGEPTRAPLAAVHRGAPGGCPVDEPPCPPGPCTAVRRAVRCQGPPGLGLGTVEHLAGLV